VYAQANTQRNKIRLVYMILEDVMKLSLGKTMFWFSYLNRRDTRYV
jgi:hypothetical protein